VGALSPGTRGVLDSYAAGVNAWLSDKDRQFGLELTLIKLLSGGRYQPEPWQPADSMVWAKLMALTLDGNWRSELLRLRLARKIGDDGLKFLIDRSDDGRDSTLSLASQVLNGLDLDRLYRDTDNVATRNREASNEWVLSGAHSVSGKPLLANDPHLELSFPGIWYLARMVGPGFDIKGASSPGSPGIVLGHNGTIGWGFTTTGLDSQDVFIERVDPTDPNRYITPDGARPFAVREETINVLWGDPVRLRVRTTRHGVVIDDFVAKPADFSTAGHVLALQATALDGGDTSLEGFMRISLAQNWDDFLAAARKIVTPMQNIVYADTTGNVGCCAGPRTDQAMGDGRCPRRADGRVRLGRLRAVRRAAADLQSSERHHRQRQRPPVPDDYRHHQPRLGTALSPAPRQPAPARGRTPSGLRHDRHPADNLTLDAAEILPLFASVAPQNLRAARATT
jgi:penicillin amidase